MAKTKAQRNLGQMIAVGTLLWIAGGLGAVAVFLLLDATNGDVYNMGLLAEKTMIVVFLCSISVAGFAMRQSGRVGKMLLSGE